MQMHARGFNVTPFVLFTVNSGLMQAVAHPLLSFFSVLVGRRQRKAAF